MNTSVFPPIASVSDFQRNYADLIKRVKKSGQPLFVLKKNKPEAVLMSPEAYEAISLKVQEYEMELAQNAIKAFKKEKKAGKLIKLERAEDLFK